MFSVPSVAVLAVVFSTVSAASTEDRRDFDDFGPLTPAGTCSDPRYYEQDRYATCRSGELEVVDVAFMACGARRPTWSETVEPTGFVCEEDEDPKPIDLPTLDDLKPPRSCKNPQYSGWSTTWPCVNGQAFERNRVVWLCADGNYEVVTRMTDLKRRC